jgi:hypothetical protein
MPQRAFSFPRQWEDWCSWLLGIWLLLSPWALFFDHEPRALHNALIVGVLIIIAECFELSIFHDWEEWINVALGGWLAVSPWVLGLASNAARWNFVVVGVLVLALAIHELRQISADAGTEPPI